MLRKISLNSHLIKNFYHTASGQGQITFWIQGHFLNKNSHFYNLLQTSRKLLFLIFLSINLKVRADKPLDTKFSSNI